MNDDERRLVLAERLTIRRRLLVSNDETDGSVSTERTPATLELLVWGINETRQLGIITGDDRRLLTAYAEHVALCDELWPPLIAPVLLPLSATEHDALRWQRAHHVRDAVMALTSEDTPPAATNESATVIKAREVYDRLVSEGADTHTPTRKPRRRRQGVTRFNYWTHPDVNVEWWRSTAADISADLARGFEREFREGDEGAFWRYLEADAYSFRAAWVNEQLETWRAAGNDAALDRAWTLWRDARWHRGNATVATIVRRDQWIYVHLLKAQRTMSKVRAREYVRAQLATRGEHVNPETVREVWREYEREYARWHDRMTWIVRPEPKPRATPSQILPSGHERLDRGSRVSFVRMLSGLWRHRLQTRSPSN
jgi:hypothetical protein